MVTWAVYPRTWGRRLLGARIRRPALINEVRTSLAGLDTHLQPSKAQGMLRLRAPAIQPANAAASCLNEAVSMAPLSTAPADN
jgi:hypothetical protein